jgi:CysZ protein
MLDAAVKALSQMFSPPLRAVLLKSIALGLALIVAIGFGLDRLLVWLLGSGISTVENHVGGYAHVPLEVFAWLLSIATAFGILLGGIFLMPAVTAFVGSFFVDHIADEVERVYYPADLPGHALPLGRALIEGTRTALLAILVYLIALPLLLFAGLGAVIFFIATAWLLGREYFERAAMRFHPPAEARALRKRNGMTVFVAGAGFLVFFIATAWLLGREYFELAAMRFRSPAEAKAMRKDNAALVFTAGLIIAAFVSIPIVNLATPLFGMAFMVHMHKRLSGPRPELIEPARKSGMPVV